MDCEDALDTAKNDLALSRGHEGLITAFTQRLRGRLHVDGDELSENSDIGSFGTVRMSGMVKDTWVKLTHRSP